MRRLTIALASVAFGLGQAQAADVFAIHGINGTDLGFDEPLPVDIAVAVPGSGKPICLEDVEFKDVLGPLADQPAGLYRVEIRLAAGAACDGALVVSGDFDVSLVDTALIVAHLDANGAPAVSKFTTSVAELDGDAARSTIYHTAEAPPVDVIYLDAASMKRVPDAGVFKLANGQQGFPDELDAGEYLVRISASRDVSFILNPPVATVGPVSLDAGIASSFFAVGSAANGTLDVIPVTIDTMP